MTRFIATYCASVALGVCVSALPAAANCTYQGTENPTRQIISCTDRFVVEREPGAVVTIFARPGSEPPRAIELQGGAILIDVEPGARPTQIRTPHAIAAVRGTEYFVDVTAEQTSVFVVEGRVVVGRVGDASTVTLSAGEGVDVSADTLFAVRRWPAARVLPLLARFGR